MATAPNVIVAGDPGLGRRVESTGRFPAVFSVASATELQDLSKSGVVGSPAAFMFAPEFDEDLPEATVAPLANGLAASGFTVLVHPFFTGRGDVFDPGVVVAADPRNMSDLLTLLGVVALDIVEPDLHPEPPPDPWTHEPPPAPWTHEPPPAPSTHEPLPAPWAHEPREDTAAPGPRHEPIWHGGPPQDALPHDIPSQVTGPPARRARRRRGPVAALVAVLVLAGALGGVIGLGGSGDSGEISGSGGRSPRPEGSPSQAERPPAPTSTPTAVRPVKEYVPGQVRIADGRVSIEVSWKDGSGGRAAHYVVGGPSGRTPSTLASTPPGTTKVVVTALNPSVDYCLTVVAVVDVDRVAHAEPVCTRRVKRDD
ncbi:hypothetical protein [Actinomadura sp. 3N407]|uniref:hypothetical protein n=1 Tax=Actinomadura sp. 3N407 TaxID=3457423 RepID=UPI003FCD16F3